jgi:histidyl-tRNA synthetase
MRQLRENNICADTDYENKSLKGAMRRASDLQAGFVVIIGDDELKNGVVTLKDMESGEQQGISQAGLVEIIKDKIQSSKQF